MGQFPHRLLWLGLIFLAVGCSEPVIRPQSPSLSFDSFDELKRQVSRLRGLSFRDEVLLEIRSAAEIHSLLEKLSPNEEKKARLGDLARVYGRLGALPEDTDLVRASTDLRLFKRAVHYDHRTKIVSMPGEPIRPSLALSTALGLPETLAREILLTQALTHALQEQSFDWGAKIREQTSEDVVLARKAVSTGDAVLLGLARLLGDAKENQEKLLQALNGLARSGGYLETELPHVPEFLRRKAAFPYTWGSQFVLWAYTLKGWEGVNSLFSRPPVSTEQILHPSKYYVKRDDPLAIIPWSLINRYRNQTISDETLGEFLIESLLRRTVSSDEAKRAAAGWAGDRLLAFENQAQFFLAWVTAWDNKEEALEFYGSYRTSLEKSLSVSMKPARGNADVLVATLEDKRSLLLQKKDEFVFFLDGLPSSQALQVAEGLWRQLETGKDISVPKLSLDQARSRRLRTPK
ncbi:MAG: hypothetical protein HY695_28110 [Deltaproteobacteria bacterium]|nr:hypothetical protein [Deltaproteobacteria bacterium]